MISMYMYIYDIDIDVYINEWILIHTCIEYKS